MAKNMFEKHKTLFTSCLKTDLKKRLIKCYVWSTFMYGAETWTCGKGEWKRIEAFEMWIWRRIEKINWTDKISNDNVLMRVGEHRRLVENIRLRKKRWIGHILRHEGLVKDVIEGRMEGKRPRGRKRMAMLDDLRKGRKYFSLKRDAENREFWRGAD